MRGVVITLMVYCILAVATLGWLIYGNTQAYNQLRSDRDWYQAGLDQARRNRQVIQNEVTNLEHAQREERLAMSGDQAIVRSAEVQHAQGRLDSAITRCKWFEGIIGDIETRTEVARGRYLPLILLVLFHVTGWLILLSFVKPKL